MIGNEILMGFLIGWYGWYDSKTLQIPIKNLMIGIIGVLGIIVISICNGDFHIANVVIGVFPGLGLLIISFLTSEKIGYGDGIIVILLGGALGLSSCIRIIWLALVFIAIGFIIVAIKHKKIEKNKKLPFVPFLFIGWLVNFGYEMIGGYF